MRRRASLFRAKRFLPGDVAEHDQFAQGFAFGIPIKGGAQDHVQGLTVFGLAFGLVSEDDIVLKEPPNGIARLLFEAGEAHRGCFAP